MFRRTTIPLRGRRVPPRPCVPRVSSASLIALVLLLAALAAPAVLAGCGGCGRGKRADQAAAPFRFIDHLAEARIEGTLPEGGGDERLVYSDPLEVSAGNPPEGFMPFAGFEPAPEAGPGERAEWSDARDQVAAAIAPGPDEREAGSRGLLFRRPSSGEFTGLYSPPIPVHPGAMYRAEVWLRTESLTVPSPESAAGLLVYGLTLGREARAVPDERIDDQDFFSNRAVTLETLEPARSYVGTTGWTRVSVTVRTNQSVDHILIELAMHGPQPRGPRGGSVRFDDLRLFEMVPPVSAIPALADHFIGGRHDLKKKVRLGEPGAAESEVTRSAILVPAPGEIAFEVRIPQPARLAFSYAVPQRVWDAGGGVTFAIEVAAGEATKRVFEATLRPGAESADRAWRSAHADLSAFAGKSATIRFVTAREGSSGASAGLWGEPVMYSALSGPPGILFISIDTLRPDHLGCYGSPRRVSPEIDRLAASGALFETCVSASSWTLPAHVSMLTGVSPSVHRVTEDARRLGASRVTLAEILRHEGYATGAFVSHYYLTGDYGLDRGFESFAYHQDAPAAEVSARAAAWLAENGDRPFFLFLHFFDPHWDYHPGAPYTGVIAGADATPYEGPVDGTLESMQPWIDPRTPVAPADLARAIDLYDAEIAGVDDALGSLFAALDESGLAARTLVVLTSDHGEEFRDHGSFGHAHTLYEELLRVPLIVRAPGKGSAGEGGGGSGARARGDGAPAPGAGPVAIRGDVAATIDLAPTILGWAGITEEMVSAATGGGAGKGAPVPADTTPAIWMPEGRDLLGDSRSGSSRKNGGAGAPFSATVADRMLVSETERFGTWRLAVRRGRLKYITPGRYVWWREFVKGPELYDLEADPGERTNREMGIGDQMEGAGLVDAATWLALTRHKGILLVFHGSETGIHSVRGKISGAHLGAATGVDVEMSDLVEEWQDGVEIALDLSARDRDVLLLRTNHPGTARVELSWDGGSPAAGLVVAGPERRSASVPFEITPGAHLDPPDPGRILAWDGPGVWILASEEEAGTTFALDEEEIARLRAIGYTE